MFYKLKSNIALRGWFGDPFTYINYEDDLIYKLNHRELDILKKCDGKSDITDIQSINLFLKESIIEKCTENDCIEEWQKYSFCANNCFSTAYWSITGKCNYNCKHCFMESDSKKNYSEFSLEECKNFLDSCNKCGIYSVVITGGEPFLHPHFMDIIYECKKRNIKVKEILTNAAFLTEPILDGLLQIGISPTIKVSFDGIGYHDWMRGVRGAEEKTIEAINLLKYKKFKVYVQMCIHKGNIDSIYSTAKLLDKIGVDKMRILRTCESPRWENHIDLRLGIQEYFDVSLKFIDTYIHNKHMMPIEIFKFLAINPKQKMYQCIPIKKNGNQFDKIPICSEMRFCINVSSSGDVFPCSRLTGYYKKYNMKFGNVKYDNMQQLLLDSKYFKEVNQTVQDLLEINTDCKECKFMSICYIGCRAGAAIFGGDTKKKDISNCIYFNKEYQDKTAKVMSNYHYMEI